MQNPSLPRPHSALGWAGLATILILATMALIAFLGRPILEAIGVLVIMLVGFAICALPFATVLGLVVLIMRHRRAAPTPVYAYAPYPLDPHQAAAPAPAGARRATPGPRAGAVPAAARQSPR